MDELVEEIETMDSEKLGEDKENPVGINGSDESLKVFDDDVSPRVKPIIESSNSPSLINESVDEIESMNSEILGEDKENPIGINGPDESLKVFGDDVSPRVKPIIESGNSPSLINESVDEIDSMNSEKLGKNNENSIGVNGSDERVKVFGDVSPREKPIIESVEEIETLNSEKLGKDNQNPTEINGSDESVKVFDDMVSPMVKRNDDLIVESSNSPSSVGTGKGKGLRKWRRIRRENVKDGGGSADYSKTQKRGLTGLAPNPTRGQKSEGSLSSTGAVVRNIGNVSNGFLLDTKVDLVGPTDSENSISSTGASGSVLRNRGPVMVAMSEKKGVNGVGKAQVKAKKARGGEREKIEKENSITSSLESDSRSSNFVFVQGTGSVASNGTQIGNHIGENSDDEIEDGDKDIVDDVEDGNSKENGEKSGDLADEENQSSATEIDPLAECILELQSAQEALEKEIQKLREMGDESQRTFEENRHETSSSAIFNLRKGAKTSPHYLKTHVNTVKQNSDVSESKLEEANDVLKAKDAMVLKLECEEIGDEIEELLKQKLEAEFQYLAISEAVEKFKMDMKDQVALIDELKSTLNVVRNAENNVNMLQRRAKKLETRVEETVEIEQVPKSQKSVCQVTSFLFIQLILLFIVFVSFILQLSPHDAGVVPT